MKYGIDVSYAQAGFDFNQAVASGKEFAIIKIGEHDYQDDEFISNINNAIDAGMDVGVYFIARGLTEDAILEEVQFFIHLLKTYISGDLACGIWLDIEEAYFENKVTPQELTDLISKFIVTLNQAGYDCGIYASYNMLTYHMDVSQFADYVKFWAANYGTSTCAFKDEHPEKNVVLWQYSDSNGQLDLDIMY